MNKIVSICILLLSPIFMIAQKYQSQSGNLTIQLEAPIDTISASTDKFEAHLNLESGEVAFSLIVEDLVFRSPLVLTNLGWEMINLKENPNISFQGKFKRDEKMKSINNKQQRVPITGLFTFNGISKELLSEVFIVQEGEQIHIQFKTEIRLDNHKIIIPNILKDAISNEVNVELLLTMIESRDKPYKK